LLTNLIEHGKWAPEVHEYYPRTPTVLVGTNEESRHSWDFINISSGARWRARPVTKEEVRLFVSGFLLSSTDGILAV